jgi:hypothetical protein
MLAALALLLRLLVPAGWMPAAPGDPQPITRCAGMAASTLWIDAEGRVHKEKPAPAVDHPCLYSALGAAIALPGQALLPAMQLLGSGLSVPLATPAVAVGRGLAAPPPPPTGPPHTR